MQVNSATEVRTKKCIIVAVQWRKKVETFFFPRKVAVLHQKLLKVPDGGKEKLV